MKNNEIMSKQGCQIYEGKDGVLLCQRLQHSYCQSQYVVQFSIYNCIPSSDPIIFVLTPGLLTSKKED